jgi:hypothetical protein
MARRKKKVPPFSSRAGFGCLANEHLHQYARNLVSGPGSNSAEPANQPLPVNGAQLIQGDLPSFPSEDHVHARGIVAQRCGHRSHQRRLQGVIHLVGGDYQTRTGLLNLGTLPGVERNQPDLVPSKIAHQLHSSLSNRFAGTWVSSRPSSAEPAAAKASLHPLRAAR